MMPAGFVRCAGRWMTDWEFTTKCGRKVYLEQVHFRPFALGVLEGSPETAKKLVLDDMEDAAKRIYGGARAVFIEPLTAPANEYPKLVYFCDFVCYHPINPEAHCSGLVTCWFSDEVAEPIREFVAARIARIDWGHYAADGYW
jgi:hypothetical protein